MPDKWELVPPGHQTIFNRAYDGKNGGVRLQNNLRPYTNITHWADFVKDGYLTLPFHNYSGVRNITFIATIVYHLYLSKPYS